MNVALDTDGVRQAALELMVFSLQEEDIDRQIGKLLHQDASPEMLAKVMPARKLADAYYTYAVYLMWLKGTLASGIELELLADEAEGLKAIDAARHEFEQTHPACPRCSVRQYSATPISCRNSKCAMKFRRER